jgi:hypothetical protein
MAFDRLVITVFFCVETFSRGLLLAIIPLDLLAYFGDTREVTLFFAGVSVFGLGNSVLVPRLLKAIDGPRVVAAAGLLTTIAAILLATGNLLAIAAGLVIRVLAGACVEIPMTSYIMERIPRHRLSAFEPSRLFFQGGCSTIAPWLGYYLQFHVSPETPFIIVGFGGIAMLFLALIALPKSKAVSVENKPQYRLGAIARFFRQPRLRLAWILALIRSSFWVIFNIYTPIFAVTCGWSPSSAAALLSIGTCSLFLVAIWGRLARQAGVRIILIAGYFFSGLSLLLTALTAVTAPAIAPLGMLLAALSASILDGAGNVPFLRATRPHERPAMAGVYMTYRELSQFAPVVMFSMVLMVAPLATAFAAYGIALLAGAQLSKLIHRRLR